MKRQINQYFACNDHGYTKFENVQFKNLKVINELPVSSRCNQILAHSIHQIQFKPPVLHKQNQQNQSIDQTKSLSVQIKPDLNKNENLLSYSFAFGNLDNQNKIMQRDQVHSIYLEQKQKNPQKSQHKETIANLTKSSISHINTHKNNEYNQKQQMRTSLCSTINSNFQRKTKSIALISQQNSQILSSIIKDLNTQKFKRKDLQQKYLKLVNLLQKNQRSKTSTSDKQDADDKQDTQQYTQNIKTNRIKRKRGKIIRKHSANQNLLNCINNQEYQLYEQKEDLQQEQLWPILVQEEARRTKEKNKTIKTCKTVRMKIPKQNKSIYSVGVHKRIYQNPESQLIENQLINNKLNELTDEVTILHQNVYYLENKIKQQEMKHEKHLLQLQLKEKQEKIELIMRQNEKIKQINDEFIKKQLNYLSWTHNNQMTLKINKNSMITVLLGTLLAVLVLINLKSAVC